MDFIDYSSKKTRIGKVDLAARVIVSTAALILLIALMILGTFGPIVG